MGRKKVLRFTENKTNELIIEPGKELYTQTKGNRSKIYYKNNNPIVLEIACGKGEYTVGLGKVYKEKNFIGIDIKGERMRHGMQEATQNNMKNVRFLRSIIHHIENFFEENEVSEIRIIHPDPRPRNNDAKKRLTHSRFLSYYKNILKPGGVLRLKTDDTDFFYYSLESLVKEGWKIEAITFDLYKSELYTEHHGIMTHYERLFTEKGRTIKYLRCVSPKQ